MNNTNKLMKIAWKIIKSEPAGSLSRNEFVTTLN